MSRQQLQNITDKGIARSSGSPPTNINADAKVVSIHDGDTCDLVFIRNGQLERFKSRLAAINTPELSTGPAAYKARDFLAWLSCGKDPRKFPRSSPQLSDDALQRGLDANKQLVYAEFNGVGGHGRPLVILRKTSGATSFNDYLIQYGYAHAYRG